MRAGRVIIAVLLFGAAFGYVEAAVVCYLRTIHEPVAQRLHPGRGPDDLFPLLTLDEVRREAPEQMRTLAIEIGREASTIAMLAAVALAVAKNAGQWAAAFAIAFGAWDIAFYAFLKLLRDWPASLATWDILFLIPVPWVGPVAAPVIVSATMIVAGAWHLWREASGSKVALGARHWAGITAGALVIIVSFTLDYRHVMAGGAPHPFHWLIFLAGEAIGAGSYWMAAQRPAAACMELDQLLANSAGES